MSYLRSLDYALLQQLTQSFGPSGNEQEVTRLLTEQLQSAVDSVQTDPLGNLILRKKGKGKKIMITCHMDEVGIIVTHIDEQGYLYFAPVGGLQSSQLIGRRVFFQNRRQGVVSRERKKKADEKSPEKIFIDIGVKDEQEARSVVSEGDMAVLVGEYQETDGHVLAKALDNRLGCFLALEAAKVIDSEHDLYFTFTAQEEVGARGAKTAATSILPDLAIIIDTTISFDTPSERNQTCLGLGAAIKVMDRSILVSPKIKKWMADVSAQAKIATQWEIITTGGTDSGPVHLTQGGIPTGGIAIPVRYLHSGNEIAAKKDIQSAYELLLELLRQPFEE